MKFRQILPLVTSGDLNVDLSEKESSSKVESRNSFESTHWCQSNAFYRGFVSLLVFELGGVVILPPPPTWRRWLRPPPGRGLNIEWVVLKNLDGKVLLKPPPPKIELTRALMGVWIFHDLMGGLLRNPLVTRLLEVVARNRNMRSKARRKSLRKYLVNFSLRSISRSPEVIKGQI